MWLRSPGRVTSPSRRSRGASGSRSRVCRVWLKIADREDGLAAGDRAPVVAGVGADLETENRELRRRARQLEQENEILRRATAYFARDVLPK